MKKILPIFGIIFLVLVFLGVILLIGLKKAYSQYEDANTYCVSVSKGYLSEIGDLSLVEESYIPVLEKQMEGLYHKCMNEKDIPDSYLKIKSPYLFD